MPEARFLLVLIGPLPSERVRNPSENVVMDNNKPTELFQKIAKSDLSKADKSATQNLIDRLTGGKIRNYLEKNDITIQGDHVHALVEAGRDGSESLVFGALLGEIDEKLGGLDIGPVPIDLLNAVLFGGVSVALGSNPLGQEARNMMSSSLTIFGFRKWKAIKERKRMTSPVAVHGETDENVEADPVLRVGREIRNQGQ